MLKPIKILLPFSYLYRFVICLRNMFFDKSIFRSFRISVPVISVGNLTAGGSGKTPVTDAIVSFLLSKGKKTAVVSRGYGRSTAGTVIVSDGKKILCTADGGGDEPVMIALRNPDAIVIADENRVRGADIAVNRFGAEAVVLDDGFQHRRIRRDLEIVLIDAEKKTDEMKMLPAGYLREPVSSLKRADAVILTKMNDLHLSEEMKLSLPSFSGKMLSSSFIPDYLLDEQRKRFDLTTLRGKRIAGFCGIADPDSFRSALEQLGAEVMQFNGFGDHHRYSDHEIDQLIKGAYASGAEMMVTTEKDSVKIFYQESGKRNIPFPLFALCMAVRFCQPDEWERLLLSGIQ